MGGGGHTTHTPIPSTPWEAWLEEILRGAQRDHPVSAEGESPHPGRAGAVLQLASVLWRPEGPWQDLGLRQMLGPSTWAYRALGSQGGVLQMSRGSEDMQWKLFLGLGTNQGVKRSGWCALLGWAWHHSGKS